MKNNLIYLVLMFLLVLLISSSGCIKLAQNALGGEKTISTDAPAPSPDIPVGSMTVVPQRESPTHSVEAPAPNITDSVTEFTPKQTPSEYVIQHGTRINGTPLNYLSFLNRTPDFTRTYTLDGYPVGLLVNVTQGPLYVVFTVSPENDCLKNPDACRGSTTVPVSRSSMTITVVDNQTNETVAEDGYGGMFSSDTGKYSNDCSSSQGTVSNTYSQPSNDNDNVCQQPGPRYIPVYGCGQYQIILDGSYLDVTVSIITGSSSIPVTSLVTEGKDES
jgi:hypothetical protein